jgi:hypothetical protein
VDVQLRRSRHERPRKKQRHPPISLASPCASADRADAGSSGRGHGRALPLDNSAWRCFDQSPRFGCPSL